MRCAHAAGTAKSAGSTIWTDANGQRTIADSDSQLGPSLESPFKGLQDLEFIPVRMRPFRVTLMVRAILWAH